MKKTIDFLSSGMFMLFLLVILIVAMAAATFIENDFGSELARMKVYNAWWFEGIMILLSINLVGRSIKLKLYKKQKFSLFLFHIAWVVMIFGAGVTRYFGYEGIMHIREGQSSSTITASQNILSVSVDGQKLEDIELPSKLENMKSFQKTLKNENVKLSIERTNLFENAYRKAMPAPDGKAIISAVISGKNTRGLALIQEGEVKQFGDMIVSFNDSVTADINFDIKNDSLFLRSEHVVFASAMGNQSEQTVSNESMHFSAKTLYKVNGYNLVLQEFFPKAKIVAKTPKLKSHMRSMKAMEFNLTFENESSRVLLWEDQWNSNSTFETAGGHQLGLYYGNKIIQLPFLIHLNNFEVERYPGSSSPSSFSSFVTLKQEGEMDIPFKIYMNNILKHHGFRFYQSSYDKDERGTILSVNNDQWGTRITYFGYALLILGIILSMLNKHSFFRKTSISSKALTVLLFLSTTLFYTSAQTQNNHENHNHSSVKTEHAEKFGELLIQNPKGRTEPIYTFASELLRKISRSEKIHNLSPMQLFIEMNMNPETWIDMPLIKVTNKELQDYLGLRNKYASYTSFISQQEGYLLQQKVQQAFSKPPAKRSKFDKAVIKADERVNICYGVFSGRYLKIFPVPGVQDSLSWLSSKEASMEAKSNEDSLFLSNILKFYFSELNSAKQSGNYDAADEYLTGLINFQQKNAGYQLPSTLKRQTEIAYYKYNPFKKLFPFYASIGLILLIFQIVFTTRDKGMPRWINKTFLYLILIAFVFHTTGIVARWYVSGHAPMSNGYESMIFISWVTLLAGFIYGRHSDFALPATSVLAGLTLMVANLSFMDPEITNLVPVLQSYWLTIHVSVITASYAFLALGTILGLIVLILIILKTKGNENRIVKTIHSLTLINHKTLILGLYLLTIGTFLGAVWANESWGRYWGWDPKETWALISVLVYTIVTHARLIPGMKGIFTFNLLAIYGFASILMTYFGVNYYLSGLHSYAGGDPVPVPVFVYYTLAIIMALSFWAYIKFLNIKNS